MFRDVPECSMFLILSTAACSYFLITTVWDKCGLQTCRLAGKRGKHCCEMLRFPIPKLDF